VSASERWILVDDLDRSCTAAGQMAADVALLEATAADGTPRVRLYRWDPPALSLGRFQPDDDVDGVACARFGVEIVRRPTGGRALLHGGDLTYAVTLPAGPVPNVDAR
jgi:lipoyl(octanoyl) transferase